MLMGRLQAFKPAVLILIKINHLLCYGMYGLIIDLFS